MNKDSLIKILRNRACFKWHKFLSEEQPKDVSSFFLYDKNISEIDRESVFTKALLEDRFRNLW